MRGGTEKARFFSKLIANRNTHRVQNVNDAVQKNQKTQEKNMKKTPKNDVLKKEVV